MSRGLGIGSSGSHRDYGATSSSSSTALPNVGFSGFSPTEFVSLSENIAQNISVVKSSWQQLERALKTVGTARDNQASRDKVSQIQTTANNKIRLTSTDINRLNALVRFGDKQQKLQVEKLTNDFQVIVEKYSASQRSIVLKTKQILLQNVQVQEDIEGTGGGVSGEKQLHLIEKQKAFEANLQFEHDMLLDREARVNELETLVIDVNDIMRELTNVVHLQGEQIDTIESSIDHASHEVESGTSELMKAAQSATSYRKKVLILLIIAILVGLIVTAIIVSNLKS